MRYSSRVVSAHNIIFSCCVHTRLLRAYGSVSRLGHGPIASASVGGLLVFPPRASRRVRGSFSRCLRHGHHALHDRHGRTYAWRRRQRRSVSRPSSLISSPWPNPFINPACHKRSVRSYTLVVRPISLMQYRKLKPNFDAARNLSKFTRSRPSEAPTARPRPLSCGVVRHRCIS